MNPLRLPGQVVGALAAATAGRQHRRWWIGADRAHIEVRGVHRPGSEAVARAVEQALRRLQGVQWAEVNAVTARVVVAFDGDPPDVDDLVEAIEGAEEAHGVGEERFPHTRPEHPADAEPIRRNAIALAADAVGFGGSIFGQLLRFAPLPGELATLLAVVDNEPRARRFLEHHVGPQATDLGLALGSAMAQALGQGPLGLVVDMAHRAGTLGELSARRRAWERLEPALSGKGTNAMFGPLEVEPRPVPRPSDPGTRVADLSAIGSTAAFAAVLAATASPRRAASAFTAGTPKAARLGREAFGAQLGRHLAARDLLVLDRTALRRLDTVDTVVLDAAALRTGALEVTEVVELGAGGSQAATRAAGLFTAGVLRQVRRRGRWALGTLGELAALEIETPRGTLTRARAMRRRHAHVLGLARAGVLVGLVGVEAQLDPFAAVLAAQAQRAGLDVVLAGSDDHVARALGVDKAVPGGRRLRSSVQTLQADGHTVLLVAGPGHPGALAAADCSVGVSGAPPAHGAGALQRGAPTARHTSGSRSDEVCGPDPGEGEGAPHGERVHPPWGAHIFTGPGLGGAIVVVQAVPTARRISRRSAALSVAGSAGGLAWALVGLPSTACRRAGVPVNIAALAAEVDGAMAGIAAGRRLVPQPAQAPPWHALPGHAVLSALGATEAGLDPAEAQRRRPAPEEHRSTIGTICHAVLDELHNPLTPLLAAGAGLAAMTGSITDAVLVAGVTGANTVIGVGQRLRTEVQLERLLRASVMAVTVRRAGQSTTVARDEVVRGDVVELAAGDVVPADCRILGAEGCEVDESILTGEPLPVPKDAVATPGAALGDRSAMLYEGTTVVNGTVLAVVVAVGADTEVGRLLADAPEPPRSGVQRRLRAITAATLPVTLASGAAVTGLGLLRGRPLPQALNSGVSLMVAAVPEGLPLLATMAELAAARRLAGRGALVRDPSTIEALGRVDLLCFDKTGTLTNGRIAVSRVSDGVVDQPLGELSGPRRAVLAAALRASPVPDTEVLPRATDQAVIDGAAQAQVTVADGLDPSGDRLAARADRLAAAADRVGADMPGGGSGARVDEPGAVALRHHDGGAIARGGAPRRGRGPAQPPTPAWQPVSELAFEPTRGFHAALGVGPAGPRMSVKGAPEVVLPRCASWLSPDGPVALDRRARRQLDAEVERLASQGLRVLAVAERPSTARSELPDDRVAGLALLGFLGLADTVRPTAAAAVASLRRAGVEVAMITGDHPSTAVAIGVELGIVNGKGLAVGAELDRLDDDELAAMVGQVSVFARVTPAHKARIVRALQSSGRVVAMTGDGANDAPAIRLAHTGIALGDRCASAARQAADLVVTDNRIETIIDAIVEGRAMWVSVRDALAILLGGNLGEIAFTVGATAVTGRSPLGARQLLLVNLLTDLLPALTVALRPPRLVAPGTLLDEGPDRSLGAALGRQVAIRAVATSVGAGGAWAMARPTGSARRASTVALVALVGTQLGQTAVAGRGSPLVLGSAMVSQAALAVVVQTPGLSQFFGCTPLGPVGWAMATSSAATATAGSVVVPWAAKRIAEHRRR